MKIRTVAIAAALVVLSGCTSFGNIHRTKQGVAAVSDHAELIMDAQKAMTPAPAPDVVTVMPASAVWVDTESVERSAVAPLELKCPIAYNTQSKAVTLSHAVARMTTECHVAVRIGTDASQYLAGQLDRQNGSQGATNAPAATQPVVPPLAGSTGQAQTYGLNDAESSQQSRDRLTINYPGGTLSGLLDAVTAQLGLSWRYSAADKAVTIYYLDTRTFSIESIATTTGVDSTVSMGQTSQGGVSGGASGGTGGSQGGLTGESSSASATKITANSNVLDDLKSGINSLLTPGIGRMAISASTSSVTVTDTPDVLDRVAAYMHGQNTVLAKQVHLHVQVFAVTLTDSDNMSLNWNAVYTNLKHNYGVTLASAIPAVDGSTSAALNILQGNPKWADSQAMFNALSTQGRVSTLYDAPLTSMNLQPVPIQVAQSKGYLASSQVSQTQGAGSLQGLEGASVTYGFSLYVLPYVLADDRTVLLQFGMNLSDLEGIRQHGTPTNFIERPDQSQSNFSQKVKLESGRTLVMTGYESKGLNTGRSGTGGANNFILGGSGTTNNRRQIIVILVTPVVQG